jgi:type IV pilus assembly protein PilE
MMIRGWSLIELLLVVLIMGVLLAVSWPSLDHMMLRARRAEAVTLLMISAQDLARCQALHGSHLEEDGCPWQSQLPLHSVTGRYRLDHSGAELDAMTYRLTAVPVGGQQRDLECGSFVLDHRGQHSVTGSASAPQCWPH